MAKTKPEAAEGEAPAAPKEEKIKMPRKNGVTMPKDGTKTRAVWTIADQIAAEKGRPAFRDEVMTAATAAGLEKGTIATQYGKWCTFYGLDGATLRKHKEEEKAKSAPAPAEAAE